MSEETEIQYSLTVSTEMAYTDIRKLEIILIRCLGYAARLTGDENLQKGIATIQRMITTLRTLQVAMRAVQIAQGPLGWAYAATSVIAGTFAVTDFVISTGE